MKKFGALILIILVLAFSLTGCGQGFLNENEILSIENPTCTITIGIFEEDEEIPVITDSFDFVLCYGNAPNTVANFISLAESGYYKGKAFEQALGGDPFVLFGEKEFIMGETKDKDGKAYDEPLYTKRTVDPAYHIIGEFYYNGYYTGSKDDNKPRNKETAKIGSMMMIREESTSDPKSKYDTAYAGFRIQTDINSKKRVEYEKKFCVFGQIIGAPGNFQGKLDNFFENSGFSDTYTKKEHCRFMIMDIKINYPSGVTKDDFKPRKM